MTLDKLHDQGFAPVISGEPHVLVLGSMPGRKSLDEQRYYAHPRNAFWWIMGQMLGFDEAGSYSQRLAKLGVAGIALWDVVSQCYRPGSLDADIHAETVVPNPIEALLEEYPCIQALAFNGQAAHKIFRKHHGEQLDINMLQLPSTSPAHASMTREEKLRAWRALEAYLPMR